MAEARRRLLAKLLEAQGIVLPGGERSKAPASAAAPLSLAQERLWFLHQLEPQSSVYHLCRGLRLKGALNLPDLNGAFGEVVRRHEILRTSFPRIDDKPVQRVAPVSDFPVEIIDLTVLPPAARRAELSRLLAEITAVPFDIEAGPLLRATLLKLGQADHIVLLVFHQLICDGWSMNLLLRELAISYRCHAGSKLPTLPEVKIQYRDYAERQRARSEDRSWGEDLAYWKSRLENHPSGVALATDRPRPAQQSFRGGRVPFAVPTVLMQKLRRLGVEEKATPFVVLMAAFNALLWRYTGQEDISVGFPLANRNAPETRDLVGFFVNTLVLRTNLSGQASFRRLLKRVHTHCRDALAHGELPFEKLVEALQTERDLSRNPLFQVMFAYQNYPAAELDFSGLQAEALDLEATTAKFDLTLSLTETGRGLKGFFEYSSDLFDRATIARMARNWTGLLHSIAADPDRRIATLPMLDKNERRQILVEWNRTDSKLASERCVHELVEAQVKRTPNAVALECGAERLTYRMLNEQANRLARYLRKRGIGAEKIVGIAVDRTAAMVVGLLAVLKAGGAYLPLDPQYPRARLSFMLADARAALLLTQAKFAEDAGSRGIGSVPLDSKLPTVCFDRDWAAIAEERASNLGKTARARNLAYVIYTSGSTGRPKGVAIEHRNAAAFLQWAGRAFSRAELAGVLASTSICFDLSVFELFAPLCRGGKIILVKDALGAGEMTRRNDVTLINTVPSAIAELLDAGMLPPSARTINLAGEPLKPELVRRLYDSGTVQKVYDLYGPSETTTYSTFTPRDRSAPATIGRPIANTKIYILDSELEPVPVGVPGELYIGGAGVARGYLRRPDLTAQCFLRDPFAKKRRARMYRSGDLARYLADGRIEYLGRADTQIKLRGYRIELGEVEAALAAHPAIRECVVEALETHADANVISNSQSPIEKPKSERRLVGYIVARRRKMPPAAELRSWLRQKLPEFMVPSQLIALDALPRTPNGKVDRLALPVPEARDSISSLEFVAPRTEIEELIAQSWGDVLGVERVGVFDNFFELGGHSLLATRVVARIRAKLQVDLALRKLFELPTVAGLAAHAEVLRREQRGLALAPIAAAPDRRRAPLSFAQRRLWYLCQLDAGRTDYNMPAAYRLKGAFQPALFERALNGVVARHSALRNEIVDHGGEPAQEILPAIKLAVPAIDLSRLGEKAREADLARHIAEDAEQPFDLSRAPLLRAKVFRLSRDEHALLVNFHHMICDGSSLALFFQELGQRYDALLSDRELSLPPPALQYGDFSAWQADAFRDGALAAQMAYWKRQLDGAQAVSAPADFARSETPSCRGVKLTQRLAPELTQALEKLSRSENATLFMTLLAGLNILLMRLSGQEDVVVGSTIAGRSRPEIENIIGFFINALALRVDLSGNPSFADLLSRVRAVCLDAYTHQELPFERVVEELSPERSVDRNPLFQVLFNMVEIPQRDLKLSGCETVKLRRDAPGAKFDLVFQAPPSGGGIDLTLVYNADLFTVERAQSMLEQWESLLTQIAAAPEKPIGQYSFLTPAAEAVLPNPREPLDETWFGAIHELIGHQAALHPEKTAVSDDADSWSYRELDGLSNRLANRLIHDGIRAKDVVAIYAHRDATIALAILGVLKTGAVFVLLDPAYPAARLNDYLAIARPRALLQMAGAGNLSGAMETQGVENLLCVILPREKNAIATLLANFSDEAPALSLGVDDPAYIAFTSGSTGEPKGVLGRHGPISHFLPWQTETFQLQENDRYGLLSGLGYNHLQRDLFTPLAGAATLYVPSAAQVQHPAQLVSWLRRHQISVLHLTPALGRLLQTVDGASLPAVRRIFFGGDLLAYRDAAAMGEIAGNATIVSFYGATETQRAVGYAVVGAAANPASPHVPTGRGARDVQLLILTADRQLAGIGEVGELVLRSPHLAVGYLNDTALSAAKFIVNPFTGNTRDRIYRTGELARYLPDGTVEWVGRKERRANIRGFRVELAEVEAALRRHPGVSAAAAVVCDRAAGDDAELIAWVATSRSAAVDADKLRGLMSARLPHYMVPARIHLLRRLPLNPNGKIDYRALARLESRAASLEREIYEAPVNALEAAVAKILAELLRLERVGRNERFFDLGGHSLLAARAAARIRETFGVGLDLRDFLAEPTAAGIGLRIEAARGDDAKAEREEREEFEL